MSNPTRVIRLLIVALWVLSLSVAGQSLVADRTLHDFGPVQDGSSVTCVFTLTNRGTTPVRIDSVSYTCGCTSYAFTLPGGSSQRAPYTLAAGQSIPMEVTFRTTGYSKRTQPVSLGLTLRSNDPQNPLFVLTFQATVLATLPTYIVPASSFAYQHYFLIDIRPQHVFAQGHLFGSVNVPWEMIQTAATVLPTERMCILVDDDGAQANHALIELRNRGYYRLWMLSGGLVRWSQQIGQKYLYWPDGVATTFYGTPVSPGSYARVPTDIASQYLVVVDLSPEDVYQQSSIPGSVNVRESNILDWAYNTIRSVTGGDKQAMALWLLDDEAGAAAYRAAQHLANAGYNVKAIQGGRAALQQDDAGRYLFWSVGTPG